MHKGAAWNRPLQASNQIVGSCGRKNARDLWPKLVISSPRDDRRKHAAPCLHPKWRFAEAALNLKVDRRNICAWFGEPHAIVETTKILNTVSSFVQQPCRQGAAQSDNSFLQYGPATRPLIRFVRLPSQRPPLL